MNIEFCWICLLFFFNDTATTEIYTLSLHDALPILFLGGDPDTERCRLAGDCDYESGRRGTRVFFGRRDTQNPRSTHTRPAKRIGATRRDLLLPASSVSRRAAVSTGVRLSQTKNGFDPAGGEGLRDRYGGELDGRRSLRRP